MNRKNNFDFLRLLFSSTVIISHSYPLTDNPGLLSNITDNQVDLGDLSVNIFFIMSGYLIFNSLKFSKTKMNYLWKRCLRLFPALFLMSFISLIIIPFVYKGDNIFSEKSYLLYLPKNMTLYFYQSSINGVFENNPYPRAINGSLWTLKYEFTMYMFVLLFFSVRKNIKLTNLLLSLFFIFSLYCYISHWPNFDYILNQMKLSRLSMFFIAGSILSNINLEKINTVWVKIVLTGLLLLAINIKLFDIVSFFVLPVLTILIGISYSSKLHYIPQKIGDISYGVYIYGFIVQQTLINFFSLNPISLTIISLGITYVLAYFSWHFVEAKVMSYKNLLK